MELDRIEVRCHEEYREAQEPRSFVWRGKEYEILAIADRWYEGYMDARRMPLRYFRVVTRGGETFILRYHEMFRAWSIVVPEEVREI